MMYILWLAKQSEAKFQASKAIIEGSMMKKFFLYKKYSPRKVRIEDVTDSVELPLVKYVHRP